MMSHNNFISIQMNVIYYCLSGHYMYIETSAPRKQGDKARLMSPSYKDNSDICVQFWYHMYGSGIGTFNVYAQVI